MEAVLDNLLKIDLLLNTLISSLFTIVSKIDFCEAKDRRYRVALACSAALRSSALPDSIPYQINYLFVRTFTN